MFICPKCDVEVPYPAFRDPLPWWRRPRGAPNRPYPVCPQGHRLRSNVFGNLKDNISLEFAFARALLLCAFLMLVGMLEDLRYPIGSRIHMGVVMMTAFALIFGIIAFIYAFLWAGRTGPVHRLTALACGTALGYMVPAIVASHALYFGWIGPAQTAYAHGLLRLLGFISHGSVTVTD